MRAIDDDRRARARAAFDTFLSTPLDELLGVHRVRDPRVRAIELFHRTVDDVPAYRAFLAAHGVEPSHVRTPEHFARLPLLTKRDYLEKYPLAERCRGGDLFSSDTIAVSSGSTGVPTFWPRSVADELPIATRFEQVFADSFGAASTSTLAVVCFPLGTWVGGMFTTACCRHVAAKGYPVFTVTPGNVKAEILRVVRELAPRFEQTILLGYPPFLKDVVDEGARSGIRFQDYATKLVLAGEVVTEQWRSLMAERLGSTQTILRGSASLYGTADAGVLGNETPLSIAIRRFLADRPDDARALFGEARLPTLVQYDPSVRYFEEHEGTLVFTGDNGVPLVRYHISDRGGVTPFDTMIERMHALGYDATRVVEEVGAPVRDLPFVHVFGRSHFAVSFFGANVFPEMVSVGLEDRDIAKHVTGKFVMQITSGDDQNHELAIAVELAPDGAASAELAGEIARSIGRSVARLSSEFASYVPAERQTPRITLHPTGDPEWFPIGVKHRYSR